MSLERELRFWQENGELNVRYRVCGAIIRQTRATLRHGRRATVGILNYEILNRANKLSRSRPGPQSYELLARVYRPDVQAVPTY